MCKKKGLSWKRAMSIVREKYPSASLKRRRRIAAVLVRKNG